MKKYYLLALIGLLTILPGCSNPSFDEQTHLSVMVPNGIPSLTHLYLEVETLDNLTVTVDRVSGPQPLIAAFTSNSHDVIIAPLNLGANLYNKGVDYQLASVITWGNLQLISGTPLTSFGDLEGKEIIAFGENSIPAMILEMLVETYGFTDKPTITYSANSAQESLMQLLHDSTRIVLTAEPITSRAIEQHPNTSIIDLGAVWETIMAQPLFPQAGIFIRKEVEEETRLKYLEAVESSITRVINNPEVAADLAVSLDYPFDYDLLLASIPKSEMGYREALESELAWFFDKINAFNVELIGGTIPESDFYIHKP